MPNNCNERLRARAQAGLDVDPSRPTALRKACKAEFQPGACAVAVENNPRTDSRESTTIVKTPRIVPNGMKRHSMQAITKANEYRLRSARDRPAIKIQIAIDSP